MESIEDTLNDICKFLSDPIIKSSDNSGRILVITDFIRKVQEQIKHSPEILVNKEISTVIDNLKGHLRTLEYAYVLGARKNVVLEKDLDDLIEITNHISSQLPSEITGPTAKSPAVVKQSTFYDIDTLYSTSTFNKNMFVTFCFKNTKLRVQMSLYVEFLKW